VMNSQMGWALFSFNCLVAQGERVCRGFFIYSGQARFPFKLGSELGNKSQ